MAGTYDPLAKRPSGQPQLGRPGAKEETLSGYTGLRNGLFQFPVCLAITDSTVWAIQAIGTVGVLPRTLTKTNNAAGVPRTVLGAPVALVSRINANAAPAGIHAVVIRVFGANQFDEPIQEDFAVSVAAGGTSAYLNGTKIFQRVYAAQIISESNTNAADLVEVSMLVSQNPVFGLPIRVRDATDVIAVQVFAAGASVDCGQNAGTSFAVNVKEQSFTCFPGAPFNDAAAYVITVRVHSTLGMDQGARRGDKYIKNW